LVVRIYPIHIKMIGVVQWYVLCPILSFFLYTNHTYIRIQAWLCMPQIGIWSISNFFAKLSI
jgi:hypothetical protein